MFVCLFLIHSASLCILVAAFIPFTFKVIIGIYVPIAIFLSILVSLCRPLSFLVLPDYISPFEFIFISLCFSSVQFNSVTQSCLTLAWIVSATEAVVLSDPLI